MLDYLFIADELIRESHFTMPSETVTLSSAGTSPVVNLNWRGGKPINASVTTSSSGTSDFVLQYSFDDPQLVSASAMVWSGVSSATGQLATHFASTSVFPDGVQVNFLAPVAALRISSTTNGNTLTLKALQGEGW